MRIEHHAHLSVQIVVTHDDCQAIRPGETVTCGLRATREAWVATFGLRSPEAWPGAVLMPGRPGDELPFVGQCFEPSAYELLPIITAALAAISDSLGSEVSLDITQGLLALPAKWAAKAASRRRLESVHAACAAYHQKTGTAEAVRAAFGVARSDIGPGLNYLLPSDRSAGFAAGVLAERPGQGLVWA